MQNRIFWRHAQAGWGMEDLARSLTALGQRQAEASADWLRQRGVDFPIYCSAALRGQETARHYGEPQILAGLNPDGAMANVHRALASIDAPNAIIVGHLPWIGQVIAALSAHPQGYVAVNYSELFWLQSTDAQHWALRAHFAP